MNKKVLIIAYYWPPSGGSGVQRWLKFVKYLPSFGWEPFVFTPENPSFDIQDPSLSADIPPEAEVIRFPIWEPYDIFFRLNRLFGGKKSTVPTDLVGGRKMSLSQKLATWIRGNFLIPDPRIFWVKPSTKFLQEFVAVNNINTIVTTGPPHSLHLIGYKLKKHSPSIRWLADFRDPWSEWGFLDSLGVGGLARERHRALERRVLQTADVITTITPFYVHRFRSLAGRAVALLTNGYDNDDFKNLTIRRTQQFIIRHVGIVNERCDPRPLMRAIDDLIKTNVEFARDVRVDFVGTVHSSFQDFVKAVPAINGCTTFTPNVPHNVLIELYGQSSLLVLILTGYKDAEGYMPGKLFEYIATGLPILGTGPENGDAAELLRKSETGRMYDASHQEDIKGFLMKRFTEWKENTTQTHGHAAQGYTRKELTGVLASLLLPESK
jgi:glycosyltransferase involved in cell wall biosynthesis